MKNLIYTKHPSNQTTIWQDNFSIKRKISFTKIRFFSCSPSDDKMKNSFITKYFAVVLVAFAVSAKVPNDGSKSDADFNKVLSELKSLKSKVAELESLKTKFEKEKETRRIADMQIKHRLAAIEQDKATSQRMSDTQVQSSDEADIQILKRKVAAIEKEKAARNGICRIKHNPCGDDCICVEDYHLVNKYFCDCRLQTTRRDCKEHFRHGARINGLYTINNNINGHNLQVFCDQTTDGGGWTVIQRRMDASENFYRNWTEYKLGFGQLHREHWLGNENIFHLTSQAFLRGSEIRFDMLVKGASIMEWAKYPSFNVNNEASGYKLHVSGAHSGNIRSAYKFTSHDGMKFSTYDRDNDAAKAPRHCAVENYGAWWYKACFMANLNGRYDKYEKYHINDVLAWTPNRLTFTEMKVRRN